MSNNQLVSKTRNNEIEVKDKENVDIIEAGEEQNLVKFETTMITLTEIIRAEFREKTAFRKRVRVLEENIAEKNKEVECIKKRLTEEEHNNRSTLENVNKVFREMHMSFHRQAASMESILNSSLNTSGTSFALNDSDASFTTETSVQGSSVSTPAFQPSNTIKATGPASSTPNTIRTVTLLPYPNANLKFQAVGMNGAEIITDVDFKKMVLNMFMTLNRKVDGIRQKVDQNETLMRQFCFQRETVTEFIQVDQFEHVHASTSFIKAEPPTQSLPPAPLVTKNISSQTEPLTLKNENSEIITDIKSEIKPVIADISRNPTVNLRKCDKCNILFNPGQLFRNHMIQYHKSDLDHFCISCAKYFVYAHDLNTHQKSNCPVRVLRGIKERNYWVKLFYEKSLEYIVRDRNLGKIYEIYTRFRDDIIRVKYTREQFEQAEKNAIERR